MVRSLRRRYIGFKVESKRSYAEREILHYLLRELPGIQRECGTRVYFRLLNFDKKRGSGILRCDHRSVEEARCLLGRVHESLDEGDSIRVVGVSGTIRSLRNKFLGKLSDS